jgi:glycosyltransferase involved in cell wall biosynthesis
MKWLGWIDHDRIFEFIRRSKVGVIPHRVTKHVDTTIPNKLFDYMGCGIPVVASNARPMARVLRDTGAGLTFENGNPESLAGAIRVVKAEGRAFGVKGAEAVRATYHWESEEPTLLRVLESVTEAGGRAGGG